MEKEEKKLKSIFPPFCADEPLHRGPNFSIEPPSRVEFSNSSGTVIPCSAHGTPHPVITWVKSDGEALQDLSGLRYVRHDGTLVFPPFPGEEYRADVHAAVYRCEASNAAGVIGSKDVHVRAGKFHLFPAIFNFYFI
ncbi:down syndrome cell adhesion molecule-like protein Dscam2 [Trichonephila clavata]|uniref:Down syndrome cell adhesion molecule-like protein Dscam2 n=1 Tax=Trichonephila clavata TaxID=2740835 RepID=A0A8X6GT26_TRICU|nr:down syndrome cell adhesion molecule-like protein Dscam2 [Trichonephila clavata]